MQKNAPASKPPGRHYKPEGQLSCIFKQNRYSIFFRAPASLSFAAGPSAIMVPVVTIPLLSLVLLPSVRRPPLFAPGLSRRENRDVRRESTCGFLRAEGRSQILLVHQCNIVYRNFFRAFCFTGRDIGTHAKTFQVHLLDHILGSSPGFHFSLR